MAGTAIDIRTSRWYNPALPRTISQHQFPPWVNATTGGQAANQSMALTLERVMLLIGRGQAPAQSE
jgi:hypothetical protein